MSNNYEEPILKKYKDLIEQVKPLSLDEQNKKIQCCLYDFRDLLSSGVFQENDERCIVNTANLLLHCCPNFTRAKIREGIRIIYNELQISPKSDLMKSFLGCLKRNKMTKTYVKTFLPEGKRDEGELIPPGKDRRGAGELLPKKLPKPTKPGKKELLTD